MQQLIKQALNTLARFSNSQHIILFHLKKNYHGTMVGIFIKGKFIFPDEPIQLKNTPLEKLIITQQHRTYSSHLLDFIPLTAIQENMEEINWLCLPLLLDNKKIVGIASLAQAKDSLPSHERLQILNSLCPMIAASLEAYYEHERTVEQATKDLLTNLHTRRYFDTRLQEEFSRVRRHGGVFSIIFIEIDHFKQINETCGVQESHRVLQQVAQLLNNSIRKELDIPSRYEEKKFALLLPNTDVDGAYVLAERIRRRCEQHLFSTLQGIPLKVTLSIGLSHNIDIAHHDEENEEIENTTTNQMIIIPKDEVLHRADLMLNAARQAGFNKVMVWW
jgi:two-component system cell cycle response regulator